MKSKVETTIEEQIAKQNALLADLKLRRKLAPKAANAAREELFAEWLEDAANMKRFEKEQERCLNELVKTSSTAKTKAKTGDADTGKQIAEAF